MKVRFRETAQIDPKALVDGVLGQMILALVETAPPLIGDQLWITSANDSKHGPNSLHYRDRALDVRCFGIRPGGIRLGLSAQSQEREARAWRDRLAAALGDAFDVVCELDHIHLEYDPE